MKCIVYLDQNNLFFRYKKLDFIKLREYIESKYEIIRATSYNSIDLKNENQKKFLTYLSNNNWRCEIVDISQNSNIDTMLVTDMCNDSNVFDHKVIVLVSGDGDYSYPLNYLCKCGYLVHIIGVKENTSLELLRIADKIDYIEQIPGVVPNNE